MHVDQAQPNGTAAPPSSGDPFAVAVEMTRMPMLFTDASRPDSPILFANRSFLDLVGYQRDEVLGRAFHRLLCAGAGLSVAERAESAGGRHDDTGPEAEFRRKDGGSFLASVRVSAVHDATGAVVQHFISLVDMTRLHADRRHLRFLLDELNHRNQNLFTTLVEMVRHTLRGQPDPAPCLRLTARILVLSRAQKLLQGAHAEGVWLRGLFGAVLRPPLMEHAVAQRFRLEGADLRVPNHAAVPLAMVFHELAANALAFGAASRPDGRVDIAWAVHPAGAGPLLALHWQESGGPPVPPPRERGFGLRLAESGLQHGLGGTVRLDFAPEGLVCAMTFPLRPAPPLA